MAERRQDNAAKAARAVPAKRRTAATTPSEARKLQDALIGSPIHNFVREHLDATTRVAEFMVSGLGTGEHSQRAAGRKVLAELERVRRALDAFADGAS